MKWKVGGNKLPDHVKGNSQGLKFMRDNNLDAFEIPPLTNLNFHARTINQMCEDSELLNVNLSLHAPFYTSVISNDRQSKEQIIKFWDNLTIKYSELFDCKVVIHPGGNRWGADKYQFNMIIVRLQEMLRRTETDPEFLYLETMGKVNQFGSFSELMEISELLNTRVCVDWAHLYATLQGNLSERIVKSILRRLENTTWKNEQYFHMSGMIYNSAGEVRHTELQNCNIPWQMILDNIKQSDLSGIIIAESGYNDAGNAKLIKCYLES